VTQPKKTITTVSARQKLELSQLTTQAIQQEGMGTDIDMTDFALEFEKALLVPHLAERITDAKISRSMEVSSILTVVVNDYDRMLLSSDQLVNGLDVQIDGLWFRLTGCDKAGDELTLTFEDREIAVLRTYTSWKIASRDQVTRAEFILSLIKQVREFNIPWVIPELADVQPLQAYDGDPVGVNVLQQKLKGLPYNAPNNSVGAVTGPSSLTGPSSAWYRQTAVGKKLTSQMPKGLPVWSADPNQGPHGFTTSPATPFQWRMGNIIIGACQQMTPKIPRKLIVCCIASAMVETTLDNTAGDPSDPAHNTSTGLYQMQYFWGSYQDRQDPATSTRIYVQHLQGTIAGYGPGGINTDVGTICADTENPAAWARWKYGSAAPYAEMWVNAAGIVGGNFEMPGASANGQAPTVPNGSSYYFWRGNIIDRSGQEIRQPESSWDCIVRLAQEVQWRAFFVSGTFYYISDDDLIKQQPLLILNEFDDGIVDVSGDFYTNKKAGTLTVTARAGRWTVPPGNVIVVQDMGIYNGRWLVSEYDRGMFDLNATITLTRPMPKLPEPAPANGNVGDLQPSWVPGYTKAGASVSTGTTTTNQGTTLGPSVNFTDTAQSLAQQLLACYHKGTYNPDNPGELPQIQASAQGQPVINAQGTPVYIDAKVFAMLLWLINTNGFTIGTFAMCSDHSFDSMKGHAGGHAVDISSINGLAITSDTQQCYDNVFKVDTLLHNVQGMLHPWQLISGGYGNHRNMTLTALCLDGGTSIGPEAYYGDSTLSEHCNHIHCGY
jgi:hypothetical protein